MLLVLVGGVVQCLSQISESGKIKIFVENDGNWENIYIHIWMNGSAAVVQWPGTQIKGTNSDQTTTINGKTFYVGTFDRNTYIDENHTYSFIINKGQGQEQSGNIENNTGDRFISTNSKAIIPVYYWVKTDGSEHSLMTTTDYENWTTSVGPLESDTYYVILNSYGFNKTGGIEWDNNRNNILRPNTDYTVPFSNLTNIGFNRGESSGSWKFPKGEAVYDISAHISGWGESGNTFSISPYFTRTISAVKSNGAYYATFSSDYTVGIPSDVTAFYAGSQSVTGTVSMTSFSNGIPAGEGAFLELKAASNDLTFTPPTSSVDVISGNMLKPTGSYSYDDTKNRYVFAKQGNNVGFFKITEDNYDPAAGKAYLEIPGNDAAPSLSIELDGETTGIKVINIDSENNQNNNQMYDLQGRRIAEPTKGVYIVNGKKVIIK